MMPPVISLLVAGSVQFAAEVRAPEDLVLTAVEAVQVARGGSLDAADPEPGVHGPVERRPAPVRVLPAARVPHVTYDWRSPVFFDVP